MRRIARWIRAIGWRRWVSRREYEEAQRRHAFDMAECRRQVESVTSGELYTLRQSLDEARARDRDLVEHVERILKGLGLVGCQLDQLCGKLHPLAVRRPPDRDPITPPGMAKRDRVDRIDPIDGPADVPP